jgi:hypothetical protein
MTDLISRKGKGPKHDAHFVSDFDASGYFAFGRSSAASIISKYDMRERMAPDLLMRRTSHYPVNQISAEEYRLAV